MTKQAVPYNDFSTVMMDKRRDFISRLSLMMNEAHSIGMHKTGHALHDSVRVVGYEMEDVFKRLNKASVLEEIATHLRKFGFSQPAMIADKIDAILRDHAARADHIGDANKMVADTPTQSGECECSCNGTGVLPDRTSPAGLRACHCQMNGGTK